MPNARLADDGWIHASDHSTATGRGKRTKAPLAIALIVVLIAAGFAGAFAFRQWQEGGSAALLPGTPLFLEAPGVRPDQQVQVHFVAGAWSSMVPAAHRPDGGLLVGVPLVWPSGESFPISATVRLELRDADGERLQGDVEPDSIRVGSPLMMTDRLGLGGVTSTVMGRLAYLSGQRLAGLDYIQVATNGAAGLGPAIAQETQVLSSLLQSRFYARQIGATPTLQYTIGHRDDGSAVVVNAKSILISDGLLANWLTTLPSGSVGAQGFFDSDDEDDQEGRADMMTRLLGTTNQPTELLAILGSSSSIESAASMASTLAGALNDRGVAAGQHLSFAVAAAAPSIAAEHIVSNIFEVITRCTRGDCTPEDFDALTRNSGAEYLSAMQKASMAIVTRGLDFTPNEGMADLGSDLFDAFVEDGLRDPMGLVRKTLEPPFSLDALQGFWLDGSATGENLAFVAPELGGLRGTLTGLDGRFFLPVPLNAVGRVGNSLRLRDGANDAFASDPMVVDLRDHPVGSRITIDPVRVQGNPWRVPPAAPQPNPTAGGGGAGCSSKYAGVWSGKFWETGLEYDSRGRATRWTHEFQVSVRFVCAGHATLSDGRAYTSLFIDWAALGPASFGCNPCTPRHPDSLTNLGEPGTTFANLAIKTPNGAILVSVDETPVISSTGRQIKGAQWQAIDASGRDMHELAGHEGASDSWSWYLNQQ